MRWQRLGKSTAWRGWLLLLLVVVVGVGVGVGESSGGGGSGLWCSPTLWEGEEWTLSIAYTDQGPQIWEIQSQFSVDVIGNRFASHEFGIGMGTNYSVFRLFYYDAKTLFTVQDGKCTTTHLEGNITQHCIDIPTKDAVEYMKESWGGSNAYQIVSGGVRTQDSRGGGVFDSVDIDSPSLPLLKEAHGEMGGVPTYRMSAYYNATYGIKDPTIFTPPSLCIQ